MLTGVFFISMYMYIKIYGVHGTSTVLSIKFTCMNLELNEYYYRTASLYRLCMAQKYYLGLYMLLYSSFPMIVSMYILK